MSEPQVHFELFVRRTTASAWTLDLAGEDRGALMEAAEERLASRRAVAVKVVKETLEPGSGEYRSVTLMTKGELGVARKARPRALETSGPVCTAPADLFTPHARERIGRLLDAWLRRRRVTPFELLHRPDLVEALDASGMELRHAIQKIAIPEAQATGAGTHEVMRIYQKLAEGAVERVLRDGRRRAFPSAAGPDGPVAGFAAAAAALREANEGAYLLAGCVARHMKPGADWTEKLQLALDLAEALAPDDPARPFALAVLDQPLAEILGSRGGLEELTGGEHDLGAGLAVLTRLIAPTEIALLARLEPALDRQFPALTPPLARLARWLQADAFAGARASLARRILGELNGSRRLRPADAHGEINVLRALAMVLSATTRNLLAPEDVQAAFSERSRSLVSAEFVHAYLKGSDTVLAEVLALVRLTENVIGASNKRAAGKWLTLAVGAPRFHQEMRWGPGAPAARLIALAELQQALTRTGLADIDQRRVAEDIGRLGGEVEADSRLAAAMANADAPPTHRLMALVRLASGETAPLGPAAARAWDEAQRLLRQPQVRTDVAAAPALLDRLRRLAAAA